MKKDSANLPAGAGFRCQRCQYGCCARFHITATAAEKEMISRLNIPGIPPAEQCFIPEKNGLFSVAKNPATGDCVFSGGGLCLIQKLHGFKAKPVACQLFPLHVRHWADGKISAEYRWICPGVGVQDGKRIAEETNLPAYAGALDRLRSREHAVFSATLDPGLPAIRSVHAGFIEILHHQKIPFALRLYGAMRVLDFHAAPDMHDVIRNADKNFAADARDFLLKAQEIMDQELAAAPAPDALTRTNFRNYLCGLLRDDAPAAGKGIRQRIMRAWKQLRIASGPGMLTELNPAAPAVPGAYFPVKKYRNTEPDAEKIFQDFWFGKLDAMHFCGQQSHRFTYEEGLRHLLIFAVLTRSLADAFAESGGRSNVAAGDMLRAVRLADFTFSASPFFRLQSSRQWLKQLSQLRAFASLLTFDRQASAKE